MQEKIIDDKILEHMTLENVFKIINDNIFPLLNEKEKDFCRELQEFCIELHPKIDKNQDVYVLFPELGKRGYMQRINLWRDFMPYGMKSEILLATHLSCLDSQLELARLASGILCGNPTFQHGETDEILKVQDELMEGSKIGCIGITEPNRGSDAVNMTSTCRKSDDGSHVIYNAEKVFTTNGPKADYFATYAVYNQANPRGTMVQAMVSRDFKGQLITNRLKIPYVDRVHIAHTIMNEVEIPVNYILGDNGKGYTNLFDGLVPERLGIMGSGLGICWATLAYAIIYTNLRQQFGQNIINFQGVGFSLGDLLARTSSATALAFQAATSYDDNILFAEHPSKEAEKWIAGVSSQGKYLVSKLSADLTYTVQQQMGGISVTDNTDVQELSSTSYIEEVIGGARNIQLLIIQNALRRYSKLILS
ncbi:MAG: Butyryl-CoA dehydrogenase [Promethearchaeota archaeon]|nr:MAG: Butyryl-CoA dehydrogenase [Candidatus Lokiarchaeota archaeon]